MTESDNAAASDQMRVLVLAPAGRDAEVAANVLSDEGLFSGICASIDELCERIAKGAGAAIVAEEALGPAALDLLARYLRQQPPWADFRWSCSSALVAKRRSRVSWKRSARRAASVAQTANDAGGAGQRDPRRTGRDAGNTRSAIICASANTRPRPSRERGTLSRRAGELADTRRPCRPGATLHLDVQHASRRGSGACGKRLDDILPPEDVVELTASRGGAVHRPRSQTRDLHGVSRGPPCGM